MKKITLVYLGRVGGAVPYSFEMTKALLSMNVEMQCILSKEISNLEEWKDLSENNSSLQLIILPTYTNKLEFIKSIMTNHSYKDAIKLIKQFNPDAIYLPMISLNARKILRGLKDIQIVTTIHDYTQHPGMENIFTKYIFDRIQKQSNKFVVLTKKYAPLLISKYSLNNNKVKHIPHANFTYYNKENKKPIFDSLHNNILFFGRITKYKGLHLLIDAMVEIIKIIPNLKLTIVGRGDIDEHYVRIINENQKNIILKDGWLPDDKVWQEFEDADMTILPYIEASQSGVAALSYSCGRTVIATNVGGLPEQVLPGHGIIVPSNDVKTLVDTILGLYSEPQRILNLNRLGYQYAIEELNREKSAKSLLDLIYLE